ncbi:hypothetical protein SAMN05720761_102202 [Fibrobacter sp. UWCM]|uniref:hypothetical protein n=1 Tax=Fibrobacter sp. UWCM TaxID=1896208 RepID=UPI00090FDD76|nr:hypothetical protein [Fibrobacter sp. UWCM]SHG49177.1 hypothetical protein SAMN05720761_102202 [Fibrobacter sp. UWCM]
MHKLVCSLFLAFFAAVAFAESVSSVADSSAVDSAAVDSFVAASLDPSVTSPSRDSSALFRVDSIVYDIGDAFDDSKVHTKYDKLVYDILNIVHIETREHTVRKLLLFNTGDMVNLDLMLESERFLREQRFLSDATITVEQDSGKNVVNVHTSDNWTLNVLTSFGFGGREWKYKNLVWGVGVQESNFLGLGQLLGFYFGHNEFRDMWQVEYGAPHFIFRYNHLDFLYSYNTDGYLASWTMYVPFLSRSVNQWAYTLAGLKNESYYYVYGSGDLPAGTVLSPTDLPLDSLQQYNGDETVELMKVKGFISDSLSFRVSRSFGGTQRKFYLGATYDYRRLTASKGELLRYRFTDGENSYAIDSASAWNEWLPERKDSRLGAYIMYSDLRYEKLRNFHNVKWNEDVDKGWTAKVQLSKNYEQIGAHDNDIRLDFWLNLYLGAGMHYLTLLSYSNFYLDHGEMRDMYTRVKGEYIFHPNNRFSTALTGLVDFYDEARYGYQLSLGGTDGFVGFPTGFYTGQARVYGSLEQRWFPDFEIATLVPVFVGYASVGETAWEIGDIRRKDLIYVLGFGARFVQTKSISKLINKLDVSIPLNGSRKGDPHFSITTAYSL